MLTSRALSATAVTTGGSGYPFERPRGPGPGQKGQKGQKGQLQLQPDVGVFTNLPGIAAPAAGVRQAPGLSPPGCYPSGEARPPVLRSGRAGLGRLDLTSFSNLHN